jgi:hypothetical protein
VAALVLQFAVRDVHRLGILDVRLYNTDRHSGNILVRRPADLSGHGGEAAVAAEMAFDSLSLSLRAEQRVELIPIDHGYCLPESLDAVYFEWLFWPQVRIRRRVCLLFHLADHVENFSELKKTMLCGVVYGRKRRLVGFRIHSHPPCHALLSGVRSLRFNRRHNHSPLRSCSTSRG